jgi:LysM repeat protein
MPIPTPAGPPFTFHIVEEGESLSYISWLYDVAIEDLVAMNKLDGPEALIQVGQSLRVPLHADTPGPSQRLLPDSEVVYSPAYIGFDLKQFVESKGGYLVGYTEYVDSQTLTGAEIVERVAEQFSVGPRLLLAFGRCFPG